MKTFNDKTKRRLVGMKPRASQYSTFFEMSRVEKFILETVHFTWMVSASQRIIILVQSLHDHLFEKEKNIKTSLNWQAFVTLITKEVGSQLRTKLQRACRVN